MTLKQILMIQTPHRLSISSFQVIGQNLQYSLFIGSLALLSFGCTTASTPPANLSLKVQSGGRSGLYTASGTTNLPDQSRLIVMAIRPLHPTQPSNQVKSDGKNSNYSILERQSVQVKQGRWQTNLNLWQVAPNGQFQEAWQMQQTKLGVNFQPGSDVTFVATFDPTNQADTLQPQIEQAIKLEGPLVRFTNEGQRYLQASETLALALPSGKTTPPVLTAADRNDGWGDRSGPTPELADEKRSPVLQGNPTQTDAPLTADQVLR